LSEILNNFFIVGVLMSLEFYCRWSSTVEFLYIFKKYLKNWGSNVVGVLLSLEFYCQHPKELCTIKLVHH
jgi:hypothetical protein